MKHKGRRIRELDRAVIELARLIFGVPTLLILTAGGKSIMGKPITKKVGETVHFTPTEFDTTQTPPQPFTIIPNNQSYTQDVTTSGTLVANPVGSADLVLTAPGTVTVTDTDSVSNPNLVLSDSVVVTVIS